jgi:CRP/FNR family cyclic AMP-dependent transcriptional regulator
MKNFDLMETQAALNTKPYAFPPTILGSTDFSGSDIPLLSNIPELGLKDLMGKAKTVRYTKEEVLASQGKADSLFLIFMGKVLVSNSDSKNGKEVSFQIQERNSFPVEIALLTNELRSASVITLENTLFAVISKSDLSDWLKDYPEVIRTSL